MSRRPGKARAPGSKAFGGAAVSGFGAFSSASSSSNLSYLSEPPDLSSISDANVIVSFKNLLKKDATTKAKALEDLVGYVEAHPYEQDGGAEEAVLEAWVQVYPRISIDNSRRVRELSHSLQLGLMKSARKRMERHVPKIVGSWLAGTFDRDRAVSRVASEGLASFLTTPEKVTQFWKKCQTQILDYASDAMLETPDTLSDERSTNRDDADAKYHRVLSGCLALVLTLLQKLDAADLEKHRESYDKFFEKDKVWTSITIDEPSVRRQSCQMIMVCLEKRPDMIEAELGRLSKVFIAEGLKSNQTGSASDFASTLAALTARYPTLWTSEYKGKRSPVSRLQGFLEKGSQGSNASFWETVDKMLQDLPQGVLPSDLEGSVKFLTSMRSGITSREEPRSNANSAWACYLSTVRHFIGVLGAEGDAPKLVQDTIFPLTAQYLFPIPERSAWASGSQPAIVVKAYTSTATSPNPTVVEATRKEWDTLKEDFKGRMKNSLPEASKDHEKSQKAVAEEGGRWFTLTGKLLEGHELTAGTDRPIPDIPAGPSLELLDEGLKLLITRNWKPFGAAATLEAALKSCPLLWKSPAADGLLQELMAAIADDGEAILLSSSAPWVLSSICHLGEVANRRPDFERIWRAAIAATLSCADRPRAQTALTTLITGQHSASIARQDPKLQAELSQRCVACATEDATPAWDLFSAAVSSEALAEASGKQIVGDLVALLTDASGQPVPSALKGLLLIAQKRPALLSADEEVHMALMTSLLGLSERSSDPSLTALRALLDQPSGGKPNLVGIIHQNIHDAGPNSLAIDTLVQQALQLQPSVPDPSTMLPDLNRWRSELLVMLDSPPEPSLSLTSSLAGSYFLVSPSSAGAKQGIQRDRLGCSTVGRMAMYTSKLLSSDFDLSAIQPETQVEYLICLGLTAEFAADQLTAMSDDKLWKTLASEPASTDAEELISTSRKLLASVTGDAGGWRDGSGSVSSEVAHGMFGKLLASSQGDTPAALYHARVLLELVQSLAEKHGFPSSSEEWLNKLGVLTSNPRTVFPAVAILSGLGETLSGGKSVSNFCNRLVSDIAGAKLESDKTLATLVLLNVCMSLYDVGELPVANNRLVFAVRQITSWLETPEVLDYQMSAEACRALRHLLPCIKDVYGPYWERAVDFCTFLWKKASSEQPERRLPYIHASLRLVTALESMEEPNDDLVDVLQTTAKARSSAILELLSLPREKETQPQEIVDSLVCRQVERLPLEHVQDLSELYSLMAAESRTIQTAAFNVLHKALPAAQEQLSLDVLLEKKTAQLPDELLSLLLEAPTLEAYSDEALAQFPTAVRSYLLTWHLVFDAFQAASFKVRSDYAESLKTENYIGPLMDFTFDVLGHSAAHGLNLDRANFTTEHIRSYDLKLAESESEERNMQWLLIHLHYLVLKYIPGLFKAWFIECRSKQTKIAVESWVSKYFSPIIISEALDDVASWAASQEAASEDDKELIVRVSRAAKEVTAGYEVDELQAAIAIKVPPAYPLEGVSVEGVNRVAVNEKKWQSWIMATQGVITFSGGSIIDGLTAFRRNVVGALKGQTECAICYSIISTDKKMPDKRCQTCKNLFHRTCLYKWFQSSNQNTCPLCRNPIDYLGADTKARRG